MGLSSVFSLLGFDHKACLLHVHHEQTVTTGISNHPRNNSMSECHVIQFFYIYIFIRMGLINLLLEIYSMNYYLND